MKSNNRKQTVELGSGPQNTSVRSAAEPRDKVEDAVRVPHAESAAEPQEQPDVADAQSAETPSAYSPRRDEHGTFPAAARIPRASDEDDEDEDDQDDENEDDEEQDEDDEDYDDDEDGEQYEDEDEISGRFVFFPRGVSSTSYYSKSDSQKDPAPTTVRDDDPEVLALLRALPEGFQAGHALVATLDKHNDPRADAVRALTTARPKFPAIRKVRPFEITILATDLWHVTARHGGYDGYGRGQRTVIVLKASPYPGTTLSKALLNYGAPGLDGRVQLKCRVDNWKWNAKSVYSAFERLRLRLVLGLFHTTPEEMRCTPEELFPLRVERYLRLLREADADVAAYVRKMVKDAPLLQEAIVAALAERKADRLIWHEMMDYLNPGWQSRVVFKPATPPPETRPV